MARAHLSGPTAALALSEAVVGVALISRELSLPEEAVSLRLRVDGPIDGVLVEADINGALRGYTHKKVLNQFDGQEVITSLPAWGERGEAAVVRSVPGRLISQAVVEARAPMVAEALNFYYNMSLQRRAFAVIEAYAWEEGVEMARGLLIECLPDGDQEVFAKLCEAADDGFVQEALEHADEPASLWAELNQRATSDAPRKLRFACRCARTSALQALAALPRDERRAMIDAGTPAEIDCHMCGHHYTFTPEELKGIDTRE